MLRAMKNSGVLERVALAFMALALLLGVAVYLVNPYHSPLRHPNARLLGYMLYRQPSLSMAPTVPLGSYFLVSTRSLGSRDPRPGEIVVFQYPPYPEITYLKRVIAVGGSTVEIRGQQVYVDGREISEPYVARHTILHPDVVRAGFTPPEDRGFPPFQVPQGQFFVLGDNRGNSEDSRAWGTVPRELMIGTFEGFVFRPGRRAHE